MVIGNIVNDLNVNFGLRIGVQVIDVLYNFFINLLLVLKLNSFHSNF